MRLTSEARVQEGESAPPIDASSCRCKRRRPSGCPGRSRPIRAWADKAGHSPLSGIAREHADQHLTFSVQRKVASLLQRPAY